MSGHGHSHDCGGGHGHSHDPPDRGAEFSLYLKIDKENVVCLNEEEEGSGKLVFKAWDDRKNKDTFVQSDVDEELLFNIPFTGSIKLKSIIVIGGEDDSHPAEMKLYKNRPTLSFDTLPGEADQTFELHPDPEGQLEYGVKAVKFSSMQHLSIFFPSNFGAENTKVYYIGLRGEYAEAHRHGVTIVNYEARANPADHKTPGWDAVNHHIS